MSTDGLRGTVALVTGASSGIGEATARSLALQGASVGLVARRRDRIESLARELESNGAAAFAVEADLTEPERARSAVAAVVERFGRLDTLVNNAGVMLLGPALGASLEEWERMVRVNVLGLLYCTHAALPHLVSAAEQEPRNVADLVNISSVAGRIARNGSGVYNMTKFGVVAFSESLRQEFSPRHVRVSVVEPGAVSTELVEHNRPEIQKVITARFADTERLESEDIADAITYIVTRPRHVAVNEMLIRPTEQQI
jgi:NADP-dependent 3-hydroxy acid dehydrogenase YdfG